jgi:hypothetical protein
MKSSVLQIFNPSFDCVLVPGFFVKITAILPSLVFVTRAVASKDSAIASAISTCDISNGYV